jgi:hypothetical protein
MRSVSKFVFSASFMVGAGLLSLSPAYAQDVVYKAGTGAVADDGAAELAPEMAKPQKSEEADMLNMAQRLDDPAMQDGVALMAEKLGAVMMQMPVGKFAAAIEKARPGSMNHPMKDDAVLADIAGPDAKHIPAMLGEQSRVAMTMMGGFAQAFASMMPQFKKMGDEMQTAMADVKIKRR